MTTDFNIKYSSNVPVQTSSTQNVNKSDASKNNSVFDEKNTNTTNSEVQAKVDKILEEICAKFAKYGITKEDLKKLNIVQKALNFSDENLDKVPNQERMNKRVIESIEAAIKDSIVKGKVDFDKANKLSGDYLVALMSEWSSVDEFKKWNNDAKHPKHSIFDRLIAAGCLPKNATIENTTPENFEKACKQLYYKIVTPKNGKEVTADAIRSQMQTFGRLFINSSPEEKKLFANVLKDLHSDNRIKGLEILLTDKDLSEVIADRSKNPEYLLETLTALNPDGSHMTPEEAAYFTASIAKMQNESQRAEAIQKFTEYIKQWNANNADALNVLDEKIKAAQEKGVEPELTKEEQKLLLIRKNFVEGGYAGNIIGTQQNERLSAAFKTEQLDILNQNAYQLGESEYKEVLKRIQSTIDEHPEIITNGSLEDVIKDINKATNGNYSTVTSGSDAPLKAPVGTKTSTGDSADASGVGYSQTTAPDTSRLEALRNQIAPQETNDKFEIVKPETKEELEKEFSNNTSRLQDTFRNTAAFERFIENTSLSYSTIMKEAGKKYSSLAKPLQQKVLNFLTLQKNNRITLLQTINNSELTLAASRVFEINNDDLQKLSIAGCFKNMIKQHNAQKEEAMA